MARCSAVKARSQTTNQLKSLLITAPEQLREQLRAPDPTVLIATCARLRPTGDIADPEHATKTALRRLARRHQDLSEEIGEADAELRVLVTASATRLIALPGVGPEVARPAPDHRRRQPRPVALRGSPHALDDDLVLEAQRRAGTHEKGELVRQALRALIERESARRLAQLGGTERGVEVVSRRQTTPA